MLSPVLFCLYIDGLLVALPKAGVVVLRGQQSRWCVSLRRGYCSTCDMCKRARPNAHNLP